MTTQEHDKLLKDNVTKTYKKAPVKLHDSINLEAKNIADSYKLSKRAECLANTPAFVTLKDHKEHFSSKPTCRLINPCKSELGIISKSILDNINKNVRKKLNLNQWKNTADVIECFSNINDKKYCTFIQLDIKEFYPSITNVILDNAIMFAKKHSTVTDEDIRTVKHCRKSLLFYDNETWKKKTTHDCFDVTIGSYDGAEICELIGLFILDSLSSIINKYVGLYHDDGLLVLRNANGRTTDKTRKSPTRSRMTSFSYIHTSSNHPPQIIKQLPKSINERLLKNSSKEEIFNSSKGEYEEALQKSGYNNVNLNYSQQPQNPKRRNRNI